MVILATLPPISGVPVGISTGRCHTGTVEGVSRDVQKNPFPLRVRIVQWSFLAAAVIATLLLARWQWDRWHDSDGTFQNLGYALQWPIFGVFFIIAYRKYMEYERDRFLGEEAPAAPKSEDPEEATEIAAELLPQRDSRQRTEDAADIFTDDRRRRARSSGNTDGPRNSTGPNPSENRIP